ncbi:enoyl-CoA hydratase [Rhizobiaceae bacterium]|nr:enoyl-CoA hydratase [Rhizobiaceae bacterium]
MEFQAGMENEPLMVVCSGGVATITLNRPERRNAITQAMWHDIAVRVRSCAADDTNRVIVLRGAGSDFSAGADISEFSTLRAGGASARAYEAANSAAFAALREARLPVIAAIRGICFGGGFGLAAACDLRIAADDALFSVPAARLGLAYPADAMADIVGALGQQMAKYLAFSGARIDAATARDAGFVLDVVEPDRLESRVAGLAAAIAENAPLSVRASKASIRAAVSGRSEDVDDARALGDLTFDSADYAEGRAAYLQKRRPAFEGR